MSTVHCAIWRRGNRQVVAAAAAVAVAAAVVAVVIVVIVAAAVAATVVPIVASAIQLLPLQTVLAVPIRFSNIPPYPIFVHSSFPTRTPSLRLPHYTCALPCSPMATLRPPAPFWSGRTRCCCSSSAFTRARAHTRSCARVAPRGGRGETSSGREESSV